MQRLGPTITLTFTFALAAAACDLEARDIDPAGGIDLDLGERQWGCEHEDAKVVCTAAIPGKEGESGAYACTTGDAEGCPPAEALTDLVEAGDLALDATPWACLLTGAHQRHCIKELATADEPDPGRADDEPTREPSDSPPADDDAPPSSDPSGGTETPPHCLPEAWEPRFCELATTAYRDHGVDITFPCEIFDATAPFGSALPGVPTGGSTAPPDAPSCSDGEWEMRNQSWLEAVLEGCTNLGDAILVMCQQGANYAPTTGACRATGTW